MQVQMFDAHAPSSSSVAGGGVRADTRPSIDVLLAAPRGFCAGVQRAIDSVLDALELHGAPVYVRRAIVHNLAVVRSLEAEGAIFIQELDEVPEGAVVILSAHGVAPTVTRQAAERRLKTYDAVCPLVSKVHREVEGHYRSGRQIVLVGHPGHPEIVGTMGHVPQGAAHLVRTVGDVANLPIREDAQVGFAVQTTYSVEDAADVIEALKRRYANLAGPRGSDICYATTNRQTAVREIAARADAMIVAGEDFSSNACRLAEVASAAGCRSVQLVADASQIAWDLLPDRGAIGITAAASTPELTVMSIVAALRTQYRVKVEEVRSADENIVFKRVPIG